MITIFALVLVLGTVYMTAIHPRQVRSRCNTEALYAAAYDFKIGDGYETIPVAKDPLKNGYNHLEYEREYQMCLRGAGL